MAEEPGLDNMEANQKFDELKCSTWSESPETFVSEPNFEVWDPILNQLALDIKFDFITLHILPLLGPAVSFFWGRVNPEMDAEDFAQYLNTRDVLRGRVIQESFNGEESAYSDFVVTMMHLKTSMQSHPDLVQFIRAGENNTIEQLEALIDGATPVYGIRTPFTDENKKLAKKCARRIYPNQFVRMKDVKAKWAEVVNAKQFSSWF